MTIYVIKSCNISVDSLIINNVFVVTKVTYFEDKKK